MIRSAKYPFELILMALFALVAFTLGCGGGGDSASSSGSGSSSTTTTSTNTPTISVTVQITNSSGETQDIRVQFFDENDVLLRTLSQDGAASGLVVSLSATFSPKQVLKVDVRADDKSTVDVIFMSARDFTITPDSSNNNADVVELVTIS